ncbi:hypothetical protein sos41_39590 [Alphaproteobacteria bacterium SO-S41]|nr:hypothetical protein sos41_39590 [Alphaproteobacteria bacterium SO-S41]
MNLLRFAFLAVTAIAVAPSALACSCVMRSAEERVAESAVIFIGTALGTVHSDEEGSDTVYTTFKVKETLKGPAADEQFVGHPVDLGGNCGVNFDEGKEVFILASAESPEAPLRTSLCMLAGADEAEIRAALKTKKSAP